MTQSCPNCGNTDLVLYRSMNLKQCPDCRTEIPWTLDPGQKPLIGTNRQDRKPIDDSVK